MTNNQEIQERTLTFALEEVLKRGNACVCIVVDISDRKKSENALTDLPSRTLLLQQLSKALNSESVNVAIAY